MRIKQDDTVIVLTGKDKGVTGKVLQAMPKEHSDKASEADPERSSRDQASGRSYRCIECYVL